MRDLSFHTSEKLVEEDRILQVAKIEVDLLWRQVLKGETRVEEIRVIGMEGVISLADLKNLTAKLAIKEPGEQLRPRVRREAPSLPQKPRPKAPELPDTVKVTPKKEVEVPKAATSEPRAREEEGITGRILIEDSDFTLLSSDGAPLMKLKSFRGEVPLYAHEAEGFLEVGDIVIGDQEHSGEMRCKLQLKDGVLAVRESEQSIFGVEASYQGILSYRANYSFAFQLIVPAQQIDLSTLYRRQATPLSISEAEAVFRLNGILTQPQNIQGKVAGRFKGLQYHRKGEEDQLIEKGRCQFRFSSGGMLLDDLRATRDGLAFLGNGYFTSQGSLAAVLRVVARPEEAEKVTKQLNGSRGGYRAVFRKLGTPDRLFMDIRFQDYREKVIVDLGEDRTFVELEPFMEKLFANPFTEGETKL